jgi:ATP-dependent protease HslVU (ClpYQ) peptidase subunit
VTTIVYRDGVFGSDTQSTCEDGGKLMLHKIHKLECDGSVFACAGATSAIMKVERWMRAGQPKQKPKIGRNTEVDCLWVKADGSAWLLNDRYEFEPSHNPFMAIGSGASYAMGCLDRWRKPAPTQRARIARVRAALRCAAKYDSNTGSPFDIVEVGT